MNETELVSEHIKTLFELEESRKREARLVEALERIGDIADRSYLGNYGAEIRYMVSKALTAHKEASK